MDKFLYPDKCPITGLDFFMVIEHPDKGMVATYGGPFDSYTIPELTGEPSLPYHERELICERYDHDAGRWVTPEISSLRICHEKYINWGNEKPQSGTSKEMEPLYIIPADGIERRG